MGGPTWDTALTAVRALWWRIYLANMAGGMLVTAYLVVSGPPARSDSWLSGALGAALLFVALAIALVPISRIFYSREVRRAAPWLYARRMPTEEERSDALAMPRRAGFITLGCWLGVAVTTGLFTSPASFGAALRVSIGVGIAGAAIAVLSSLLAERALRPATALVLAGSSPSRTRVLGVQRRLVLFWLLGSGIPLVAILVSPIGHSLDDRFVVVGMLTLAGIGLVGGSIFMVIAARSVSEPLADVRAAMSAIGDGDLDAEVIVDDDGEVGLLQAGFNAMAHGLRERQRLADLFGRHVGEDVARQALAEGVHLGGELRDVTAFFVDVAGSTAIAESQTPTRVVAMLNRFFETVVDVVAAEGGWVNKFEGDAALCVFGAPIAQDDHADRALRVAPNLRDALDALKDAYPDLDFGIGVASGTVIAGNVGSEQRYEYTVIGSPVNQAARLTDHAKTRPSRVLVSASTIGLSRGCAAYVPAGEAVLRGVPQPVVVYEPRVGR